MMHLSLQMLLEVILPGVKRVPCSPSWRTHASAHFHAPNTSTSRLDETVR